MLGNRAANPPPQDSTAKKSSTKPSNSSILQSYLCRNPEQQRGLKFWGVVCVWLLFFKLYYAWKSFQMTKTPWDFCTPFGEERLLHSKEAGKLIVVRLLQSLNSILTHTMEKTGQSLKQICTAIAEPSTYTQP